MMPRFQDVDHQPTLRIFTASLIINLEGVGKNIGKVLEGMKCEKCDGKVRVNSHDELWCKNCAMLIHACKCHLTKEGEAKLKF